MLRKKDRLYARKRKKLWDTFDWTYKSVNALSKNHSLNCGCSICRYKTYSRRYKNKQNRLKEKMNIRKELEIF